MVMMGVEVVGAGCTAAVVESAVEVVWVEGLWSRDVFRIDPLPSEPFLCWHAIVL